MWRAVPRQREQPEPEGLTRGSEFSWEESRGDGVVRSVKDWRAHRSTLAPLLSTVGIEGELVT